MTITPAEFLQHRLLLSLFFGFEMPKPQVLAKTFQLVNKEPYPPDKTPLHVPPD